MTECEERSTGTQSIAGAQSIVAQDVIVPPHHLKFAARDLTCNDSISNQRMSYLHACTNLFMTVQPTIQILARFVAQVLVEWMAQHEIAIYDDTGRRRTRLHQLLVEADPLHRETGWQLLKVQSSIIGEIDHLRAAEESLRLEKYLHLAFKLLGVPNVI